MTIGSCPSNAFPDIHSRFNNAKLSASDLCKKISTHIDSQINWLPIENNIPDRKTTAKLNEMEELANELKNIYDRYCNLEEMW